MFPLRTRAALFGLLLSMVGCDSDEDADDTSVDSESMAQARAECLQSTEVGKTGGSGLPPLMNAWGAPCQVDADCVPLLGEGAVCDSMAVVYELPGKYCTKPCQLPDTMTTVVHDDPTCDPNGGVHCVGQLNIFERCIPACTEDAQCNREGYLCRQMPSISAPQDPTFCLMPDCCLGACGGA